MFPIDFFENIGLIKNVLADKDPVIFLDYDGTLTPIVATPDLAVISDEMREVVRRLSQRRRVSIVSGRATDDVRSKVKIEGIFYAGSHGFEIDDPDGGVAINEEAKKVRSTVDEIYQKLAERVAHIKGALIENVKYTVSCHYRLVNEKDIPEFERIVNESLAEYPQLRKTRGKKVFELRPRIDWDKGKAVKWILNVLRFDPQKQIAVYIGDDTTDEDAFKILNDIGFGVLVSDPIRESSAKYTVKNVQDVKKVLEFLSV
jgi:trehalose-phosphatase